MKKTRNKEGGHSLNGFIALCQSRSSRTTRGISRRPASVLAPESALGSFPNVALSSAQAGRILSEIKAVVALAVAEPVKNLRERASHEGRGRSCANRMATWVARVRCNLA